jgi:hypothetical protein
LYLANGKPVFVGCFDEAGRVASVVREWTSVAKRIGDPELAQTFANRARLLTRTAMEAERAMALANGREERVLSSRAKTLDELKRELQDLSDGMDLCVPMRDYLPDHRDELWRASPHLSQQFGCSVEFRPDGCLWFVKHR